MKSSEFINVLSQGLFGWYPFKEGQRVLLVGENSYAFKEIVEARGGCAEKITFKSCADVNRIEKYKGKFDVIICLTEIETEDDPSEILRLWRDLLKDSGRIFLGVHNRLGLKYFCGDKDPYTNRPFDGLDNYREIKRERMWSDRWHDLSARCYSLTEMKKIIQKSGYDHIRAYAVFPDIWCPQLIYAENYTPKEALISRYFPIYNDAGAAFMEEESLIDSIAENGMLYNMANAYLIEISKDDSFSDMKHATLSMDRGKELATCTVITKKNTVEKFGIYPAGIDRLHKMIEHKNYLEAHHVHMVDMKWQDNRLIMPYVQGELGSVYLGKLLKTNIDAFFKEMDRFVDIIRNSSDIVDNSDGGILERGYADLVPLNSFYIDGEFYFFDQEFCLENYPINVIIERALTTLYFRNVDFEDILPINKLRERYSLMENFAKWDEMRAKFSMWLRKGHKYEEFNQRHIVDYGKCKENRLALEGNITRQRDRYNYQLKIMTRWTKILQNRGNIASYFINRREKNIVIYGAAIFGELLAREIMKHPDLKIECFLDRNAEKIKEKLGVPVYTLEDWNTTTSVDIVVVTAVTGTAEIIRNVMAKNPEAAVVSVETIMGDIENEMWYDKKCENTSLVCDASSFMGCGEKQVKAVGNSSKPYHIGYVAGVFDLFHIGHLNILRRAKEHCDYLIVGVVSDRQVREYKKVEPFVPFNERLDMVRSCKFVDEAHEIPIESPDTDMAWKLYHFDVQFSGSDYENDPAWIAKQQWLRERGAEMVFFPYTETTSSTKLKKLIEERLI